MHWLTVRIDTVHEGLDEVAAMLSTLGIDNIAIDDEADFQEFLQENRDRWDYVDAELEKRMRGRSSVTFYLPETEQGFSDLAKARIALQDLKAQRTDLGSLLMTLETVEDADWENNWKQYYKPIEVGERLLIVPQWETAAESTRTKVVLDPGLSFGTGDHDTTRLCLTLLEGCVRGGERVLDLGCGSGILSIAALRLGAEHAVAVDIDELCQRVATDNAALNGIGSDRCRVLTGDILHDGDLQREIGAAKYDLILANIVADVILALIPMVPELLAPGGRFLCSGIIDTRAEEVASRLKAGGFRIERRETSRGWYAFACTYGGETPDPE